MKISNAKFAGSSARVAQRPAAKFPEFAFIGRSNVGKSSLINMLCGNGKLAMTSSTPGKTKLVNHFLINNSWYLVDLPGYGYARLGQKGRDEIENVIRDYIHFSDELIQLFVLIDSRYDICSADLDFLSELGENDIPFAIIFTKTDKQGPNVLKAQIERDCELLSRDWAQMPVMFCSSSKTGAGKREILDHIGEILNNIK